jgi:hypothetical protein
MKLFRKHLLVTAHGSTVDLITMELGEPSKACLIRHIAAWDVTNACSYYIEVGIGDVNGINVLNRITGTLTSNQICAYSQPFILPHDEGLYAAFTYATASDKIHMFVMGEYSDGPLEG